MTTYLTTGQRAWIQSLLEARQAELDQRLSNQLGGSSRVEHTREVLLADSDDLGEREGARQLDMTLSDRELREVGEVSAALRRVNEPGFGLCSSCGQEIPFDRLKVEPWALRCIGCEEQQERAARGPRVAGS